MPFNYFYLNHVLCGLRLFGSYWIDGFGHSKIYFGLKKNESLKCLVLVKYLYYSIKVILSLNSFIWIRTVVISLNCDWLNPEVWIVTHWIKPKPLQWKKAQWRWAKCAHKAHRLMQVWQATAAAKNLTSLNT